MLKCIENLGFDWTNKTMITFTIINFTMRWSVVRHGKSSLDMKQANYIPKKIKPCKKLQNFLRTYWEQDFNHLFVTINLGVCPSTECLQAELRPKADFYSINQVEFLSLMTSREMFGLFFFCLKNKFIHSLYALMDWANEFPVQIE